MLTYSCHFKLFEISLMLMGARLSDLKSVPLHRAAAAVPLCGPSGDIPGQTQTLHFFRFILALTPSFQLRLQLSHGGIGTQGCGRSPSQAFLHKSINSHRMIMIPGVY